MQYRELVKNREKVSLLSYGCMRFPSKAMNIDKEKTFEQLKYAFDEGVNYFDTAYFYHKGKSEVVLGEFIKKFDIRDKIFIADKLPAFMVNKKEDIRKFFSTQLKRLDTSYIDYYLMHMLSSLEDWNRLKSFGIIEFIDEKKKTGEIVNVGFSFHGRPEEFIKILEDYNWDFCQIQFNYLDTKTQAGEKGLLRAYELGVGVVIMEPLRGGLLASKAPTKVKDIINHDKEKLSPAYWGLRFIMNYKEVATVLSGMNDIDHIKENVDVANNTLPDSLNETQIGLLDKVKNVYDELTKVPCTACNYCMPCPFGVDIPGTFSDYNSKYFFGKFTMSRFMYIGKSIGFLGDKKSGANQCVACGKCAKHCPQNIDIPAKLKEAHRELDNKFIRYCASVGTKLIKRK